MNKSLLLSLMLAASTSLTALGVEAHDFVLFFNTSERAQSVGMYVDGAPFSKYIVGGSSKASPELRAKLSIDFTPTFILIIPRSVKDGSTITFANEKSTFSTVKGEMKQAPVLYVMLSDNGNMTTAQMGDSVLDALSGYMKLTDPAPLESDL